MNRFRLLFMFFLFLGIQGLVAAEEHSELKDAFQLSVGYMHDADQSLSLKEAMQSHYTPTASKQCFELSKSTSWYEIIITNPLDSAVQLFLHNNRGNLSQIVELYDASDERSITTKRYDFFDPKVVSKLAGGVIVYPFSIEANGRSKFYIKNKSLAYQCIDIEIHNKETSIQALINNNFYSNLVVMIIFTMAIYNLFLYSFIRRKEFIYYTLYLVNAGLGLAYYYGIMFHHLQLYGEQIYWFNLTAILGSIFLVLFIQSIIDTKKKFHTLHHLLNSVLVLSVLDVLIAILFDLSLAAQLVFILFAYTFVVLGYMAVKLLQYKHPLIKVFSFAYMAYIIGMAVVSLMFMGLLPLNELTFLSSGIGIIIEAFLFSYLLHHRLRLLMRQKIEAEGASRRKTRFLASASHDLRQPVHALELFLGAFSNEELSSKGKKVLSYMKESVSSLNELLSSLLDISRLDAGIVSPSFKHFDAFELINRLANNLKSQADDKGLKLHVRGQHLWVNSDAVLLENTLRNLLGNAIKYTNEGGVLISCRSRKDEVWIEVWDTGIGIPEVDKENIFDEFYQVNNVEQDRRQGLGLGLSIVTREMKLLDHFFSLRSREGRGTVVRIKLHKVHPKTIHNHVKQGVSHDRLAGKKVLIIDDEKSIQIATETLVSGWECTVKTASNMDEASTICKEFTPDVIISDFRLQDGVTCIDVITHIRDQVRQQIPAILVTGDTTPDKLKLAKESDLILLHKPVKPANLRVAMNIVLTD